MKYTGLGVTAMHPQMDANADYLVGLHDQKMMSSTELASAAFYALFSTLRHHCCFYSDQEASKQVSDHFPLNARMDWPVMQSDQGNSVPIAHEPYEKL